MCVQWKTAARWATLPRMDAISLTKPAARGGAKVWFIARDGATVETRSGTEGKPLKSATETHADEGAAQLAMDKALRTKLRDGYAFVGDRSQAPRGAVVFACFASGGGSRLHHGRVERRSLRARRRASRRADGRVGRADRHRDGGAQVVFEREHPRQLFLLSTNSIARASGSCSLSTTRRCWWRSRRESRRRSRATQAQNEASRSNFNAHVLRPKSDRARTRSCVFDANTTVRVLDERFATVSEIPLGHPTTELRAASISPDEQLIALFQPAAESSTTTPTRRTTPRRRSSFVARRTDRWSGRSKCNGKSPE